MAQRIWRSTTTGRMVRRAHTLGAEAGQFAHLGVGDHGDHARVSGEARDGVMTTDPRLTADARVIPVITYAEMGELAYFGAKVLHPRTIRPVVERQIPLRIRNTFNPTHAGTLVVDQAEPSGRAIKAVTCIKGMSMITVEGRGMIGVPGVAARTFGAVASVGANVLMISQASSEQSICFVVPAASSAAVAQALEDALASELARRDVDRIVGRDSVVIVTAVGAGMRETPGVASQVFGALAEQKINVIAIAQGSSECSISVVIAAPTPTRLCGRSTR